MSATPGPWEVDLLDADTTYAVIRAGSLQIASVGYAPSFSEPDNARLIAAAPDLLAALRELLAAERVALAEAAIAKAEGRQ